ALATDGSPTSHWTDVGVVLDEEISRLPARYRLPFILCYLQNQTNEEAARQLGCAVGTVFSRLARGRERLRQRLTRRGVILSTGLLTTLLDASAAAAAVSPTLAQAALNAALGFAAPAAVLSPNVIALSEGVLRAMFINKLKTAALLFALAAFLIVG